MVCGPFQIPEATGLRRILLAGVLALSAGTLVGCTEETPTATDGDLLPVEVLTVEVSLPFSEFGLPEYSTVTHKGFEMGLLTGFVGVGLFVGGALIAAIKLYAERRETIENVEEGGS